MRKLLRTVVIGLLVATMSFNPASAWSWFRGGGCGYGGYGGYGGYYSGFSSWGHGGGWGHRGWGHHHTSYGCGSVGYDGCGSYGGYYSAYDSYGGYGVHDSCGCGGYSHYDGEVIYDGGVVESYDHAPMPPAETTTPSRTVPPPRQPTDSQRPRDTTPLPELPEEPMPRATETMPPAEEPDDLFGTEAEPMTPPPADTTPPAEEPADDIFGTPPDDTGTTPPEATPPDTSVDDLFGTSDTMESTPPAGTESTPPAEDTTPPAGEEESTDAGEDIFGTGSSFEVLRERGGLASSEMRNWVDNTGNYSCQGRLVRFLDNHVRLLKDNGRTTTVPLGRLSANDLQFVYRQASAHQAEAASQLAHSLSPMPLLAY